MASLASSARMTSSAGSLRLSIRQADATPQHLIEAEQTCTQLMHDGDYSSALQALDESITLVHYIGSLDIHLKLLANKAACLAQLGRYEDALDAADTIFDLNSNVWESLCSNFFLATAISLFEDIATVVVTSYFALGRPADAMKAARKAKVDLN